MMKPRRILLGALAAAALASGALTIPALAGPASVSMSASTCGGAGSSNLSYPAGYGVSSGCAGSGVYISSSSGFCAGGGDTVPGDWYGEFIVAGFPGTDGRGAVCSQASTHNLSFGAAFNGFVGTNTW
jgi:hypothetical protein